MSVDAGDVKREAKRAARTAADSKVLEILARVGFGASALLQVLLGALAIQLGVNHFAEADQTGALEAVSKVPGGVFVLWISVVGLFALALWLIIEGALVFRGSKGKKWAVRLSYFAKAGVYIAIGLTALAFADGHPTNGRTTATSMSAGIMALPGGPLLLGLAGLLTVAVGGYLMAKGVRQTFTDDIVMPTGPARIGMLVLGTVGYLAKGVVVAIAGVLFIVAAIKARPDEATGLAGAMESIGQFPVGAPLLFVLGAGLIASGIYNAVRAWLARF
ncbi:DUF1206 domain-containing protein [Leifsonia sp. AG29]|uniref:DUF1206 domain-containing protein n=1 Tax=Leifsonia sp. AG29 TaxID=2598860 RepID=UPI00131B4493|nr:DUF1206 domain-containing protein [Leifsonia sp. AG29]